MKIKVSHKATNPVDCLPKHQVERNLYQQVQDITNRENMKNFLGMTNKEWKGKYMFLGMFEYCPDCGKETENKMTKKDGTTKVYCCNECKVYWTTQYGQMI